MPVVVGAWHGDPVTASPTLSPAEEPLDSRWWAGALSAAERAATRPPEGGGPEPVAQVPGERPEWAEVVERVLAASSDEAPPVGGASPGAGGSEASRTPDRAVRARGEVAASRGDGAATTPGDVLCLAPALEPFLAVAADHLNAALPAPSHPALVDADTVRAGLLAATRARLVRTSARALVLDLHHDRVRGALPGATSESRFAGFLAATATRAGLTGFVRRYPVLARLLAQTITQDAQSAAELVGRYLRDRAAIVATLLGGTDPGPLVRVTPGMGDRHRGGRTVAVLHFADGRRIVHKPRPVDLSLRFTRLVDWVDARVPDLGLRAVRQLAGRGYGWAEFVEHLPCAELTGVDRFYRRQGALLALLYLVDGTDVHYENLVAHGEHPVVVDVETLFHPAFPPGTTTGGDPALTALLASVHRTALLPRMLLGPEGAVDLSGLGGDPGARHPDDGVRWVDTGRDTMRLERVPGTVEAASNRPGLPGAPDVEPAAHVDGLVGGFRATYEAVLTHRAELLADGGPLRDCAGTEQRVVFRDTSVYATLLAESTHPDAVRSGADRDRAFAVLSQSPELRDLVPCEVAELWRGDVPLFTTTPDSRDVHTGSGRVVPDRLPVAGLDAVLGKVRALDEVDRRDQEWLIRAALDTRTPAVSHHARAVPAGATALVVPDVDRLLTAACAIGDSLVATAEHDERRANWLGLQPVDDRYWAVLPMGAGLGDGYCGVAVFLAQLGALTGIPRYTGLARRAVRPLPALLAAFHAEPALATTVGVGAFQGLAGISYALARLSTLLDDPEPRAWLDRSLPLLGRTASARPEGEAPEHGVGLATGWAGAVAVLASVHEETGSPEAAEVLAPLADRLHRHVAGDGGLGGGPSGGGGDPSFPHGTAGVGWALLRAGAVLPARPSLTTSGAALLDAATRELLARGGSAWCHGIAGPALAWAGAGSGPPGASGGTDPLPDAALEALTVREARADLTPCHGELGVVEALTALTRRRPDLLGAAERGQARVLGALERTGPRCGTPSGLTTPGLLTGLAGIGYGLLRLALPDVVPSVLALHPGPRPPTTARWGTGTTGVPPGPAPEVVERRARGRPQRDGP
ncbi:type 2 lantibiotic biosynthesis protein LanM [Actinoalloteichus cyanogriseus DSM 43889]|uniref:Type 2 lantibiotic biosynthesis protein LanM n=1 Tax=Actinoalloteichus caeruleus DSM 43889 TaxID=1120930 RepID=A0ABT1JFB0_ACTCY|nr:type 2 lantibiotic biosynthesis protein LanM [Actinoalloteichus caeruleus DSM 43889]